MANNIFIRVAIYGAEAAAALTWKGTIRLRARASLARAERKDESLDIFR